MANEQSNISPLEPEKIAGEPDDFFTRMLPEQFTVLGLKLKPLSIGRYRLMRRFGVSFVSETESNCTISDLILGVIICSRRCDEFLELLDSKDLAGQIKAWSRSIGVTPPFLLRWKSSRNRLKRIIGILAHNSSYGRHWRARHSFDILEKIKLFQRYILEGSKAPEYWDESKEGRISNTHWSCAIEVTLRGNLGWRREEIDEQPLTVALQSYFKFCENEGLVRLMADDEVREMATPLTPAEAAEANESARKALEAIRASRGELEDAYAK